MIHASFAQWLAACKNKTVPVWEAYEHDAPLISDIILKIFRLAGDGETLCLYNNFIPERLIKHLESWGYKVDVQADDRYVISWEVWKI